MRRLSDPETIAPILNREWPWTGFALGDLEPEWMAHSEWVQAAGTLVLLFDGLSPRLLCPYGDNSGLNEILSSVHDERVWANIRPDDEAIFRKWYDAGRCVRMVRMYLDRPAPATGVAQRLTPDDEPEIRELLKQGEWVLFLPGALAAGHYYGVRIGGRLAAIAGTHLASVRYDTAAVGSVFTHPGYRGRGLATVCTSHVLASVAHQGITRVVLNVEEEKAGARRVYERLGFKTHCVYLDGACERRATSAP